MVSIPEIFDRAETGLYYEEKDFDLKILLPAVRRLVKEYDIRFNPEHVVPEDDDLAKRVFNAALDLLCDVGTYCVSTGRIIKIEENEVRTALKNAPSKVILGAGTEEVEIVSRGAEDNRPLFITGGPPGGPVSEEYFTKLMYSYAKEPAVKMIHTGAVNDVEGRSVKAGTPIEMIACRNEAVWSREAVRRAGKPGMPIIGVMSGVSSEAQASADFPEGLRPTDPHLLCQLNELKMNWERFNLLVHNQKLGNHIEACMCPILGGYCGDPEGTVVAATAEILQGFTLIQGDTYAHCPLGVLVPVATERGTLWVGNMAALAVKTSANLIINNYVVPNAGPCTEMICYEMAAQTVANSVMPVAGAIATGSACGAQLDTFSGMEARIVGEIADAAIGLTRGAANEIVKELLKKYEQNIKEMKAPLGKKFYECYDLKTVTPTREYIELWNNVKKELGEVGLKF